MWYVDFASKSIKMVKKISRGCAPDPRLLHPSLDEHPRRPGPRAEAQSTAPSWRARAASGRAVAIGVHVGFVSWQDGARWD